MNPKTKYYRNKTEVKGCELESLWKLIGKSTIMTLVDDDQYIFVNVKNNPDVFYEVPDPFVS